MVLGAEPNRPSDEQLSGPDIPDSTSRTAQKDPPMTTAVTLEPTTRAVYYDSDNRRVEHAVPRCQEMLLSGRQCGSAARRDRVTRETTGQCGNHGRKRRQASKAADVDLAALKEGMDDPWTVDVMSITAGLIHMIQAVLRENPEHDIGYVLAMLAGTLSRGEPPDDPDYWSDLATPVVNATAGTIVQALAMFAWSIQEAEKDRDDA